MSSACRSNQKKAGGGGLLSGIQTLEWKRLRLIHIFSKPLNYSDTYRARLPVLLFQASGNCQEPRDPEFPPVRPTSRWARCWRPAVSGAQAHRTSPAWWGSAGTQRPRLCARDLLAFIRRSPGVLQPRRRELGDVGRKQGACAQVQRQLCHHWHRSPAVPWGPAVPRAPLLPPLALQSQRCPLGISSLLVFPPNVHGETPEVQENPSRWTLGVHLSLPSPEQGSSLS